MNYFLMINYHPPLIIYNEDKGLYYECLRKYDEDENLEPLHEFIRYETEKTWAKAIELKNGIRQEHRGLADFT